MMTGKRTIAISAVVAAMLGAWVSPLRAAPDDKPPKADPKMAPKADPKAAAKPAAAKDNAIVVTAVTGLAQQRVMSDAKAKWQKVKVGDVLNNLTVIRTGLGSKVVIRMGDRGDVTIKSATKVGIKDFAKKGNLATMRLGMKYGSMSARVDASRGANDFRVSTPVATLSVRGSIGGWGFWGDRGLGFYGEAGNWQGDYTDGSRNAGPGEWMGSSGQRSGDIDEKNRKTGLGDPQGQTPDEQGGDSSGQGGGFNPGGGQTTGGPLTGPTPPAAGATPPPIHPPIPPPAIND